MDALPHSDLAVYALIRCPVQTAINIPLLHTHRARGTTTRTISARDALYACTRLPLLRARMVVRSGRASDALPHSHLAANTRIRCHAQTACPQATLAPTALVASCDAPKRHRTRSAHAPASLC